MKKIDMLKYIDFIEEVKREETLIYTKDGRVIYSEQFKTAMLDLQNKLGMNDADFASMFFSGNKNMRNTIGKWRLKKNGEKQFGYKWGKGIAYDVVDKARMVKLYIEDGKTTRDLSNLCGKSPQTISDWVHKFSSNYQEIIDKYPRGIMYIMDEKKKLFTLE